LSRPIDYDGAHADGDAARGAEGAEKRGKVLGGAEGNRTPDLLIANEALYHLSYGPKEAGEYGGAADASSAVLRSLA
jgi:hypothetical protein